MDKGQEFLDPFEQLKSCQDSSSMYPPCSYELIYQCIYGGLHTRVGMGSP